MTQKGVHVSNKDEIENLTLEKFLKNLNEAKKEAENTIKNISEGIIEVRRGGAKDVVEAESDKK